MIQVAAKCPRCGAGHNPLVDASLHNEAEKLPGDPSPQAPDSTMYTWLCESCGETYRLDGSDAQ